MGSFRLSLGEPGAQAWVLDRPEYWLPQPSRTFHGRDIFAPVAARAGAGMLPEELGSSISDAVFAPAAGAGAQRGTGTFAGTSCT